MTDDAREDCEGADRPEDDIASDRRRLHELLAARQGARGGGRGEEAPGSAAGGAGDAPEGWSPLVPIQPLGSKPPFFIVHAILGSTFPYHRLALALGAQRPVFGLQSRGLDGRQPPMDTIPQMAEAYVKAVRAVQPKGPYHLGGYSMGGWIAFEMAQQLRKAGQEVAVLAAMGTPAPMGGDGPMADSWKWAANYWEDFVRLWRNSALADSPDLQAAFFGPRGMDFGGAAPGGPPVGPAYRVAATNALAQTLYVAEKYGGGVDVFLTTEQTTLYEADPTMGWKNLCSDRVAVYHVHGNHLNLFHEPQVLELAEILARRLDGAPPVGGDHGQG